MINGGIINFNGGAGGTGGSSSGVTTLGVIGGAALAGAINLSAPSGFVVLGDNGGSSPITIAVDVHAMSGLWGLSPGGGGAIDSVGVLGGVDLTGDIDFTDPSGFIVWGDSAGSSPITASVDTHALSGLWNLNQININKSNLAASGQVLLNELNVSGQVLLGNDAASGQILLNVLNVSGQVLLENDNASGQYLWSELKGSGQLLLSNTAASGQLLVPNQDCDWNGFPNRDDSIISFDHSTRIFSIQPTGSEFAYYIGCTQYLSTGDTVTISADEGVHFIYYDGPTIVEALNPSDATIGMVIKTKALVSAVYWGTNQASGLYVGDERHGMSMSPVTHDYLHFTEGLRYLNGLGLNNITVDGNGNADDYAVFGVDQGEVCDEDICHDISTIGSGEGLPVMYMTGATPNWNKTDPSGFSVRTFDQTKNTRLAYNQFTGGAWQLTEVGNNQFVLCHVFAITEKDKPMIAIMGQETYITKPGAQDGAETEILSLITNDILLPEIRAIATIIFRTSNSYSNSVKGAIVSTADGDNYIDWRSEEISRVALTTSNHNNLNGLQGGVANEYFHLTEAQRDNVITLPASGQVLLNELAISGQVLLGNDAVSGQVLLTELNVSGQVLLENTASSGQVLLTEIGNISGITSAGMMVLNAAQSATISGQDVYIRAGAHVGFGSIHNRCRGTYQIGDQVFSPKDDEGTPWDVVAFTRHGIYMRPDTYFVVGDGTQGQWSPTDIFMYSGNTIKLFPSGIMEIGDSSFVNNTPDNINFYAEDGFKARIKNTYGNNYEYGIDISSDNIALITVPGNRPTINTSGIALLNEVLGSGQNVVTSVGVNGGANLKGDVDFSDPSGFIVWGDNGGVSPVTASIDVHALSGLWNLNANVGSYQETISVAAATWTITHNLNTKNAVVRMWDNTDFDIAADSIKADTADQITIIFSAPVAGRVNIIGLNGGTPGDGTVNSIGAQGGADLNGDVDLASPSGFITIGDENGSSPVNIDVDVHALSGLWNLGDMGGGDVASVGVEGGAALTGAIEFSTPSGFMVWGDSAGANPITLDLDFHALSGTYKDADAYAYLQGSAAALNPTSGTDYTTLNLLSEGSVYRFKKNIFHENDTQNIYFGMSGIYAIMACLGTNHNVVATQNGIIGHYSVNAGTYAQIGNSLRQMQVATTVANQIVINYLLRVEAGDFINFQGSFSSADPGSLYLPNQVGVYIHRVCEGDILLEKVLP